MGFAIRVSEMLATFPGKSFPYIARIALNSSKNVRTAKKYITKAFSNQINENGFSMVEFLSICPTNLKLSPEQAISWVGKKWLYPNF